MEKWRECILGSRKKSNGAERTHEIEWNFTEKTEKFAFITKEGIKQTTGVIKAIGEKYFGLRFDIDKFLNSTPSAQSKELQRICGLDFTEIDSTFPVDSRGRNNGLLTHGPDFRRRFITAL